MPENAYIITLNSKLLFQIMPGGSSWMFFLYRAKEDRAKAALILILLQGKAEALITEK